MAANGTNQSSLRQLQGGAQRDRGSYERDQYYNRATSPNTINNQSNTQGATGMRSNFGYNPMGSQGVGGQYGTQQGNLGRYRPPTMNGNGGWNDNGGYAYNLPNAYGSTGLGYMSGLGNMFSPWQGNMNPQMNYGGGSSFQEMLQGLYGSLSGRNRGLDQYGRPESNMWATIPSMDWSTGRAPGQDLGNQSPNQSAGRDNRMNPGGGSPSVGGSESISRFGRYPADPSIGIAPNTQTAPSVGGSGGGISRPGGGTGAAIPAPSPVGGITTPPPQRPRLWWGANGGG